MCMMLNETLRSDSFSVPVHALRNIWIPEWSRVILCAAFSAFYTLCRLPAFIEGGCYIRFFTHGSWDTEMHEGAGTSCEHKVHSHMAAVQHHVLFIASRRRVFTT